MERTKKSPFDHKTKEGFILHNLFRLKIKFSYDDFPYLSRIMRLVSLYPSDSIL